MQPGGVNAYMPSASLRDECGLGSEGAGVVIGQTSHAAFSTFKEVDPSRLSFVGQPVFDPSPFLDERSRKVFRSPMDCSKDPACYQGAIPFVQVHCPRSQKIKLFELLDSSRRQSLHTEDEIRSRFCSGMFAVVKSLDRDRLILDSRPPNLLEIGSDPLLQQRASVRSLLVQMKS